MLPQSLQRLSSSASNNRLKTCLQFLIIKVNEKSITAPSSTNSTATTTLTNGCSSPKATQLDATTTKDASMTHSIEQVVGANTVIPNMRNLTKRQKSYQNQNRQQQQQIQKQKHNQIASPPQDQVSSTQDGQVGPTQDDHDCQTSPPMLSTTHIDEQVVVNIDNNLKSSNEDDGSAIVNKNEEQQTEYVYAQTTQSSPPINYKALSTTTNTTTMSTSPKRILDIQDFDSNLATINSDTSVGIGRCDIKSQIPCKTSSTSTSAATATSTTNMRSSPMTKRRRTQNSLSSDQETSSVASWSLASYATNSPPSPISSASSISSVSSSSSSCSSSFCSSSSCLSSPRHSPSPSPLSSPDMEDELKGPRLKLSEEKIRKIKKRPVLFDDLYYFSDQPSVASTPTTSSGCSPASSLGQNTVNHMFQAPPTFVNNLKPCNLPSKPTEPTRTNTPPVTAKAEMINCAICGIKDRPPNISKMHGQNSCILCINFFTAFLHRPQQLYCAQDGDCLMTFDSRCQACWIKICLQKFDIDEGNRKIGHKYSPKLLSSPNVSLITIDTSVDV